MRLLRIFSPGRIILVATFVVGVYFLFSAGTNLIHSYRLESNESRLRAEVDNLQVQMDELQQVRDYLRTDDYVEYMARRVFGLVKPGETLVIVQAPQSQESTETDGESGGRWWERLFSGQNP